MRLAAPGASEPHGSYALLTVERPGTSSLVAEIGTSLEILREESEVMAKTLKRLGEAKQSFYMRSTSKENIRQIRTIFGDSSGIWPRLKRDRRWDGRLPFGPPGQLAKREQPGTGNEEERRRVSIPAAGKGDVRVGV
ncbi:hypothetical protein DUI87_15471 [Hirundo rustica rustica]|uniref:Uncharacterized protein n=1 Tax=Hirundo rustica rustica TaxID=333673 RepID=A0A3M0K3Z3_HIRRU|nr:hypothetical protein DUI87_15471 [Hirundo rustica rustica]